MIPPALARPSDAERPLLILDADEVLLQFVAGLESFLAGRGLELRLTSFQLVGNVYAAGSDIPVTAEDMQALLRDFFSHQTLHLEPVPGAVAAVNALAREADIVILSNVPEAQRPARARNLAHHGLEYPLIANDGGKGAAVAALAAPRRGPVAFVDDLPPQHRSVAEHAPAVHRLHLVADPRLRSLIPKAPDAHARIDDWPQAGVHLRALLNSVAGPNGW